MYKRQIIALRKGDTEAHAAIIKQIETYQNVHSSVLADAGTWFAGLFVDAGQNRVDDWDEITEGGLYPDGKTPEVESTDAEVEGTDTALNLAVAEAIKKKKLENKKLLMIKPKEQRKKL